MLVMGAQDAVNLLRFFDDLPDPRSNVNCQGSGKTGQSDRVQNRPL